MAASNSNYDSWLSKSTPHEGTRERYLTQVGFWGKNDSVMVCVGTGGRGDAEVGALCLSWEESGNPTRTGTRPPLPPNPAPCPYTQPRGLRLSLKNLSLRGEFPKTFLLALIACSFLLLYLVPMAHAASGGRIAGQLLDGTRKNAPVVGQSVTLQMAQGNTSQDLTTVKTDAHGAYTFSNLATDSGISYVVYTKYQGAQYTSPVLTLTSKPVQQVNLTVYEATTSTADIAIVRATVLLREPDAQKGLVSVSELFIFRNLNARTYVGSLDASQGKPNALLFTLPHTARNVSLGKGFDGYSAIQVNSGFASDAAVPPGDSQFAFTFDMPYTISSYDFDYTVQYPTVQLMMLIPPDIHASSSVLSAQGPVTADQRPLDLFQATALTPNQVIHVQLDGLPAVTLIPGGVSTPTNSSTPWFIIVLGVMAVILLGTWLLYRSTRRTATNATTVTSRKKGQRVQQKAQPAKKVTTKAGDTSSREQELLQELLALDESYEAGKLKKTVYQERRTRLKAQLSTLMSEKVSS